MTINGYGTKGSRVAVPPTANGYLVVRPRGSSQAAFMVQVFVITTFLLPSDTVIRVIGAQGYVASLVAMLMFLGWVLTAIFGFHDPLHTRYPIRGALAFLWISSLLSYVAMPLFGPTETQRLSAERWLMLFVGMSGVILVAAEHLRSPQDIMRVVRALVWGAACSGVVAILQFWAGWDLKPYLRMVLVGFQSSDAYSGVQARGALMRVSGTANHPIEMGVIAAMVLPMAIWLGLYERGRSRVRRWAPVVLIGVCIPFSISRSAILAVLVSLTLFVVLLPVKQRAWVMGFLPFAIVAVFATTPGYLKTIAASFGAGNADPSITNRLDNYPRVLALVAQAPWLGRGGGTYIAPDATKILDNQYLKTAIEQGMLGVLALVLYFLVPAIAALVVRSRARDPRLRALCAALSGACLAAGVGSYTFDSFSFAQFASVHAIVLGLCGTCWLAMRRWPRRPDIGSGSGSGPGPPDVSIEAAGPRPLTRESSS